MYRYFTFPTQYSPDPTAFHTEEGLFNEMEIEWILNNHEDVPYEAGTIAADRHVVSPSFLLHRVTPVHSGTRKSLVLWVGGGSYR